MLRSHDSLVFVDHMRPVHLLSAVGVGTLGPDRVLPLPPASVKPLLVTTETKIYNSACSIC